MDSPTPTALRNKADEFVVRYLDTTAAYDLWSEVYDTDGNFLQALDTIEMRRLLPQFLSHVSNTTPWKIVDLGCGTGRNTTALLQIPHCAIVGLDASPKMLEVARIRLQEESERLMLEDQPHLAVYDLLTDHQPPAAAKDADAVVSTLVLEHVPIPEYFNAASRIVKMNGMFLVTNMHSEMGGISQAGFIDPRTGEKIRPTSYAHRIDDVVAEARRNGFEVVGDVLERSVDEELSPNLGPRAQKWKGVTVWFGIMFRKIR